MKFKEEIKILISKGYSIMIVDPDGETFNDMYRIVEMRPRRKAVITNNKGKIIALQG